MITCTLLLALHSTYLYIPFLTLFSIGVIPDYGGGESLTISEQPNAPLTTWDS
jgi:hypothetical protein